MSEKFRNNILKNCGLWPNHYLSPNYVMLKLTKIELELIQDPNMSYDILQRQQ